MLETRSDLETELQLQLQSASNSTLFPSTRLTSLIQNAYREATTLFKWLALARAKTTDTIAKGSEDNSYYDYPEEFRTNTVFRVEINNLEYNRKSFESFLDYVARNPSNTQKRIFANYQRFVFISPDTTAGTANMDIWGIIQAPELSSASSETIFTGNADNANLAIVSLALALATKKIDPNLSQRERSDALMVLGKLNSDEWAQYARDQQLDTPMFAVPDFFGQSSINSNIGRFDYDPAENY